MRLCRRRRRRRPYTRLRVGSHLYIMQTSGRLRLYRRLCRAARGGPARPCSITAAGGEMQLM